MKRLSIAILITLFFVVNAKGEWVGVMLKSFIYYTQSDTFNLSILIHDIDCADSMNCFAVGEASGICNIIYRTTDAGRNWKVAHFSDFDTVNGKWKKFTFLIRSLSYPTVNKCVAGGDSGIVFKTDDGGKSWHRIYTPIFFENIYINFKQIKFIKMLDSTYGIAGTSWARLLYTSDGGNNWVEIPMPDTNLMNRSIAFADIITPTTIYVAMFCNSQNKDCPYRHTFLRTYDLGKTWEFHDITWNLSGMRAMYFADSLNGWMVGGISNGVKDQQIAKIVATTDGGRSWNVQFFDSLSPMIIEFLDVSFHDKNNGIAVSRGVQTVYTTDGGKNWIPENVNEIDIYQGKYYLEPPSVCFRNVKEPLIYAGGRREANVYYRVTSPSKAKEFYSGSSRLTVVPNPAENRLIVKAVREGKVEIFNVLGTKLVESFTNTEIDISSFPSGVYFIVVRHSGQADVIPVVVE